MEEKIRFVLHTLIVLWYIIASVWAVFLSDFENVTDDRVLDMQKYGGRYFTTWNFLIHLIYFASALVEDFLSNYTPCKSCLEIIAEVKGYMFTTFLVPFTTYVFTVFWSLFKYDRELVFPEATDEVVPWWFNQTVHTIVFAFMVLEFYFTERNVQHKWKHILVGFTISIIAYYSLFFYTKSKTDRYFYGLFHQLAPWQIVLFLIASYFFGLITIQIGIYIQQLVQMTKNPVIINKGNNSNQSEPVYNRKTNKKHIS
ncbi:androgen-dependent TFPI-regulating protein-like [Harmonia axyridis]|uniref:androgen-dependent TFPI-regulating protein-like n=1 Tax=Harmonia axyridis TaxID=115357 RepID=UPI001E279556|nr:androgen-dependent TFPI-regulating protein-like [Harmonia axyridis]